MSNLTSRGVEIVGADAPMTSADKANVITSISTGVSNIAQSIFGTSPTPAGQQREGLPEWVIPAGIGILGLGVLAIVATKKK